jgi:hypothetical protein
MRLERLFTCALTVGILAPFAAAQDYGDRDSTDFLRDNAAVDASIVGFAGGEWRTLNTDAGRFVKRSSFDNPMFVEVGEIDVETNGETDMVEAAWWDLQVPTGVYIQFVMRTQNGGEFVPFGSTKDGDTVQAYSYEMGGNGDGIDFRNWVTDVIWEELTISYSYDGGQTVFTDPTISDPINGGDWSYGTDSLHLGLAFPGDGVNWIQASYKIELIPAPASAMALLGAGAFAFRRRRS